METLEMLGRQIQAVHDLQSVVKTMKGLAAVNIRQFEQTVAAMRDYRRSLELGMQIVLRQTPRRQGRRPAASDGAMAAIILGSDQGMCGQFNTNLVAHVERRFRDIQTGGSEPVVIAVGLRIAAALQSSGQTVATSLTTPGSVAEIGRRVEELVLHIDRLRAGGKVQRVWVFHQHPRTGASYEPHSRQILPFDPAWLQALRERPWPTRMIPMFTMERRALLAALTRQYLFATFYGALGESLAAENAARLAAMQAAESNVEERLGELTSKYHRRRQNTITEELLDVIAGFELLGDTNPA